MYGAMGMGMGLRLRWDILHSTATSIHDPSYWNIPSIMIFGSFFAVCTLIKVKVKSGERNSSAYISYSHGDMGLVVGSRPGRRLPRRRDQERRKDIQVFLSKEGLT